MCASALGLLGIRRAVFGPGNDKFGGCGSILSLHLGLHDRNMARPTTATATGAATAERTSNSAQTATINSVASAASSIAVEDGANDPIAAQVITSAVAHFNFVHGGSSDDGNSSISPLQPDIDSAGERDAVVSEGPSACGCGGSAPSSASASSSTTSACPHHPYAVTRGVRSDEAIALLQTFYSRGNERGEFEFQPSAAATIAHQMAHCHIICSCLGLVSFRCSTHATSQGSATCHCCECRCG